MPISAIMPTRTAAVSTAPFVSAAPFVLAAPIVLTAPVVPIFSSQAPNIPPNNTSTRVAASAPEPPPRPSFALSASVVMSSRPGRIPKVNTSQVHNRILALMAHTNRYAFKGESRLAKDAGVSKSAVCRLLNGQSSPSFALVSALTRALEPHLQGGLSGRRLDPHELISLDGTYPTASACELAGCKGCLPTEAYDEHNRLRPEFKDIKPGQWSLSPATPSTSIQERKEVA